MSNTLALAVILVLSGIAFMASIQSNLIAAATTTASIFPILGLLGALKDL